MPKQNTSPAEYPQAVLQQIELLGQHIAIARKRRGETQAQWARRLGVSQPTMARIERGDPSVAMASYAMCMWLVNPAMAVADVIAPQNDHAALEREIVKVRRKSAKAKKQSSHDVLVASAEQETPSSSAVNIIPSAKEFGAHPAQIQGSVYEAARSAGSGHSLAAVYSAAEKLHDPRWGEHSSAEYLKPGILSWHEKELDELKKPRYSDSLASAAKEFAELNALGSRERELRKLHESLAGSSTASAAYEQARLQALSSGESELQKLHESATGGAVARATEEYMRGHALNSWEDELTRLQKSLTAGTVASAVEQLAKNTAMNSHEDVLEKRKQSLVGGSVANGLAALILQRQLGFK